MSDNNDGDTRGDSIAEIRNVGEKSVEKKRVNSVDSKMNVDLFIHKKHDSTSSNKEQAGKQKNIDLKYPFKSFHS